MNHQTFFLALFTIAITWGYISIFLKRKKKISEEKLLSESIDELKERINKFQNASKVYYFTVPICGFAAWMNYLDDQTAYMFIVFVIFGMIMNYTIREIEYLKTILTLKEINSNKAVERNSDSLRDQNPSR